MKQIFLIIAVCLMMAACDTDAEFATRDTQAELLQPEGIEVSSLQAVSISYAPDGDYLPAGDCTDQGTATHTLATRGDLCVCLVLENTTKSRQTVNRRDFALDFDGHATRTPSAIYQGQRAVTSIVISPENKATVILYYANLMPAAYPGWAQLTEDVNALYSIDIRLGAAATYLVGFDLYTTTGADCWIKR